MLVPQTFNIFRELLGICEDAANLLLVKEQLSALVQAQQLDARLAVLERRLTSLPAELQQRESEHAALQAALENIDEERKASLVRAQSLENEVRQWEARVHAIDEKNKNMRDAGAIQVAEHEKVQLREKISRAEEEALRLLEKGEGLVSKRDAEGKRVEEFSAELEQFRATVAADQADLREEQDGVRAQRETLLKDVAFATRELYEKLLPTRKNRAVAPLRAESCGGCGMVVPPNDRVRITQMQSIVQCRSCTRMLVPQEVWAPTSDAAEKES